MKKRALFIDRDGVINLMVKSQTEGFDSPQRVNEVRLVKDIAEVISYCNKRKIPVIEISNQPGVAKGKMSLKQHEAIEKQVHTLLKEEGVYVDGVYICLHHPSAIIDKYKVECDCRKPKPGLLLQASSEMNINLKKSVFIGDNISDMKAGSSVGCQTILFFHENDTQEKDSKNKSYKASLKTTSHKETLELVINFFS